ncbi:MAG: YbaK/EbsC family protein [Gammaproteobacteria bacterium]|nr:YbaK/EbsC family protein [Gammaproteobacteria bacterium]
MSIKSVKKDLELRAPDLKIIEHNISTASVEEAAQAHKVKPGQIVKTLALMLDEPILLMVAGDTKIDNKKFKNTFKKKAKMLSKEDTETQTSHPIGGVCPFGLPRKLTIYADISLNSHDFVIPAAGSKNSSVIIGKDRLLEMAIAIIVDVTVSK